MCGADVQYVQRKFRYDSVCGADVHYVQRKFRYDSVCVVQMYRSDSIMIASSQ